MEWVKDKSELSGSARVPVKSWCADLEPEAMKQAANLAAHPVVEEHVALMPDCHVGYGMPIGGVIACRDAVIPNAVGVDIGCGMCAVRTTASVTLLKDMTMLRTMLNDLKALVPVGEGHTHKRQQEWEGFASFEESIRERVPGWFDQDGLNHDRKNLGTLGGGNHFIELQADESGTIWMMLHSGSRNLGHRVASFYHRLAQQLNTRWHTELPSPDLAFLPIETQEGQGYIRDMSFALAYALENRRRMMEQFKCVVADHLSGVEFREEINIHHNYAALEHHFGRNLWIHRKGATSARKGESGIIPGSMGTPSYIVRGLGNPESFLSCSHGAGRSMGRTQASRSLTLEECDKAMEGIVFERWRKAGGGAKKRSQKGIDYDFGEAPQAYKNIDQVIASELDLIEPLVKLCPLGVIKG